MSYHWLASKLDHRARVNEINAKLDLALEEQSNVTRSHVEIALSDPNEYIRKTAKYYLSVWEGN